MDSGLDTTRGNIPRQAIDGLWDTMGTKILSGGYLPIKGVIQSDHWMLWIKVSYEFILGSSEPPTRRPDARNLRMNNSKTQKK